MMRVGWAGLVLLATAAAGPQRSLPIPPLPPPRPPLVQSAPTPNRDVWAPAPTALPGPQVSLRDFRSQGFSQNQGYTPGSQYETAEDKRPIQTPGLAVSVPLQ
jgi:hypothetical protein